MARKQYQLVGDHSTVIQAEGDVSIATPYTELRAIVEDLFKLNFPKVQEMAMSTAQASIDAFLGELKKAFGLHKDKIDPAKFADPGIQFEMQAMCIDAARRGERSHFDLLSELLCTILEKKCPELIELISVEARKAIPMLAKRHLCCLSLHVLATEARIDGDISSINEYLETLLEHIEEAEKITPSDLHYIACTGTIIQRPVILLGMIPQMFAQFSVFNGKSDEQSLEICKKEGFTAIQSLIEMTRKCKVGNFQLSATGKLIGWLSISRFSPVDIEGLFL